jgi:predicted MFS family arabinose efflux permease
MSGIAGAVFRSRLPWLTRDARLLIASRAIRTLGYGCTSVLIGGMLVQEGFAAAQVGLVLAVAAAGCVTVSVAMGLFADRFGRRRSLLLTSLLMALAGLAFAVTESYPLLLAAAFIGTISPSTNDNTPFSGVEQAILAQTCAHRHHPTLYTAYNSAALLAGALGGLAASGLSLLFGVRAGTVAFLCYAALAVVIGLIFTWLSPAAEALGQPGTERAAGPDAAELAAAGDGRRSRLPAPVRRLAALFAIDAFAGGMAVQAILALWFQQRYHVPVTELGVLFFAANLLPALSQLTAPLLAARGGLLPTMLVPHAMANLLLLAVPLAPSFSTAATLLLVRMTLSKIDVPARQAFVAAIVTAEHRTAAASLTMVARSVAVSVSPLGSSLLLSGALLAVGAPLLLGGSLGIGYDALMWRTFRRVPLHGDETDDRALAGAGTEARQPS